jgi:hypothetical protein
MNKNKALDKNKALENMKKIFRCMQMEARGCSNPCSTCDFYVSAPQRGATVEAVIAMWEPAPTAIDYIYTVVAEHERKRGYFQAKAEYDAKMEEEYKRGYEQAKEDCTKAVRDCYENILDVETDGHTIADSVEDIITERVRRTERED